MCGIAGVAHLGDAPPGDGAVTRRMLAQLVHRGPDHSGVCVRPRASFGTSRLSIVDPQHGDQPMTNEDGTVHVVMNGEIYSFAELRRELIECGHDFQSRCDTEVVVHGYEEWGIDGLLSRLDGMFAFAILDERIDEIYLARDRLGIKPLYYAERPDSLLFASELRALVGSGEVPAEPDPTGVRLFLQLQYVPAPHSPVRGVRSLPPASCIRIANGKVGSPVAYWKFPSHRGPVRSDAEWRTLLEESLSRAVRGHLIGDTEIGVFLSGGIDSSIVLGLMSRVVDAPIQAFSIGFDDSAHDETHYARLAAQRFSAKLHTFRFDTKMAVEAAELLVRTAPEAIADPAYLPTLVLSRHSSEHVKVVQTGEGADELFAGYGYYARWQRRFGPTLERLRHGWQSAVDRLQVTSTRARRRSPLSGYPYAMPLPVANRFLADLPEENGGGPRVTPASIERQYLDGEPHLDALSRALRVDAQGWLPSNLLTKVDRATMAFGLEARVPFLDHQFVELVMQLPPRLKRRGDVGKYLLRETFKELLGDELAARRKHGFSLPLADWIRGPLLGLVEDALGAEAAAQTPWIRADATSKLLRAHVHDGVDHARRLWTLFTLVSWFRSVSSPRVITAGTS